MDIHNHFKVGLCGAHLTGDMKTALEKFLGELGSSDEVKIKVTIDEIREVKFGFQLTDNEALDNQENAKKFYEKTGGLNLILLNQRILPNSVQRVVLGLSQKMQESTAFADEKKLEKVILDQTDRSDVFCGIIAACYDNSNNFVRFAVVS